MKCGGNKLCENPKCKTCFKKSFASSDKAKYWSKKNDLSPRQVSKSSMIKYEFNCDTCKHKFFNSPKYVNMYKNICPFCTKRTLCEDINCDICINKSFLNSDKAEFWSDKNISSPLQVFKGSKKSYIFDCGTCGHEFNIRLDCINDGQWCCYCSHMKLCENDDCNFCHNNSFASNPKSKFWSKKNLIKPRQVFKSTVKKFLFDCECGHEILMNLSCIHQGKWCGYCYNSKLCSDESCQMCFNKSFASQPKSKYWSKKNIKNPREVFKSSPKKYFFVCEKNHDIFMNPNSISNGKWCLRCVNKTEEKLHKWLEDNCYSPKSQAKFEWCKSKTYLPFDFCLEDFKILIELDGPQHFKQISNWESPDIVQERDIHKMKLALDNGYTIIRLLQEDVWRDSFNWESYLSRKIYCRKNPKILFCDSDNQYKKHKKLLI
uniref:Restriction endonuclease n=1 Tax=Borely moumouvirus TaxID=2712067 RepID=A0A6G6AD62_9VIRU